MATVLSSSNVAGPFQMPSSHHRISSTTPLPPPPSSPSSRKQPSQASSSSSSAPDSTLKPFTRIRSTLEQSLRAATRSKKMPVPVADDFATITTRSSKGKERVVVEDPKEKSGGMLRRLESKVNFRRSGRESVTPSPSPIPPPTSPSSPKNKEEKVRVAGNTSYITPSLRQASISSPALHLSSQALPSPKSQSVVLASSSSHTDALASPVRERTRRSLQPPRESTSSPRHEPRGGSSHISSSSKEPTTRHRPTKSFPVDIPTSPSSSSLLSPPETPKKSNVELSSPPETPTPYSSRTKFTRHLSLAGPSSTAHPLNSPPGSPLNPRGPSPIRARSPTTTRRVTPSRGLSSSSTSHLPISPSSSPTPGKFRDTARRTSFDAPRRPSFSREDSPSPVRPRPTSPNQRSYSQNRHYNVSSTSLNEPSNPEQRESIRIASSMLCKTVLKPPPHMSHTEAGIRAWEEVELRTRALVRLERIWGKSGVSSSSSNVQVGAMSSSGLSAAGEERERRLFTEALRDGFVLCQLLNKIRQSNVVRPDPREDGFSRTSNITKFLAACSSYGLSNEDLFLRDDLIEASGESLARVAKTIITLIKSIDNPITDRSKFISGKGSSGGNPNVSGPYKLGSHSASSSPNLVISTAGGTHATSPSSPTRKRWSPSGLPTVSDSPNEGTVSKAGGKMQDMKPRNSDQEDLGTDDRDVKDAPPPPPRSPLRARSLKPHNVPDEGKALFNWARHNASPSRVSAVDSTGASIGDDYPMVSTSDPNPRQSMASTTMTDITTSTVTTVMSSLMDVGRSSSAGFSKFGTIRTMTTEATSETPSITRTEGSSIADDLRKRGNDPREKKLSEAPVVDLSRVAEETDDSESSRRGKGREEKKRVEKESERAERVERIRLGKGKWPEDFMDALGNHISQTPPSPASLLDLDDRIKYSPSQLSSSPRKVAIVDGGRRNGSVESLPQFPRRPTHRARHSLDSTPSGIGLLPKEAVFRRDVSPDGLPSSSRVILRRNNSARPSNRNGARSPREEPRGSDNETTTGAVPFPRSVSGEHTPARSSWDDHSGSERPERPALDVPRQRGRFQSDIEGTSRRRGRPTSHDELGVRPTRSRFESMVNLGGPSGHTSASDLMSRDSIDNGAVRKPLIIKEEGKLPTHFQLGNCIGRGQFGSVYRALNLNTGQMVAVKRIRLEGLKEEEIGQLMREVDLVKSLSHPSIVKYEGMHRDADTLSIVLEYAENGSLAHTIKAFGKLNEKLVASYVVRILEGLHYLHQCEVVHCDLKAANILTTKNGNVKLSDFGVSLNMRAMEREMKDVAGTPNWMAPEVIELKGASPKSDIWSLACTVIELFTGRPPYGDIANSMSVMFRIVEDDMPPIPPECSPLLEDFLKQCFNKDPDARPSAELLCEHEWLKQNWGAHKELRPQDSIPFLRRVSADLHKSDAVRLLAGLDIYDRDNSQDNISSSPRGRKMSSTSMRPSLDNEISPREHSFVKTTFSKPMVCRVCLLNVKKSAVLCESCSLICHSKCAINAPPTCDLRAQLLLYAQYAEKGNPGSVYSNPVDIFSDSHPKSPMSDVAFVSHTPRTSLDTSPTPIPIPQPSPSGNPPTAFKFMGFKRPRHHGDSQTSVSSSPPRELIRKPTVLRKNPDGRPQSLGSSTNLHSSVRSANTAASGHKSTVSEAVSSAIGESIVRTAAVSDVDGHEGHIPGGLIDHSHRHRKTKSSNNCIVQ